MNVPTREVDTGSEPGPAPAPGSPDEPHPAAPDDAAGPASSGTGRLPRRPRRGRWGRRAVTAAVTLTMMAYPFLLTDPRSPLANAGEPAYIRLYSNGIGLGPDGAPELVATGSTPPYLAGSRVLDPGPDDPAAQAEARALAAETQAWLDAGTIPGEGGPYGDMVRDALLDIRALLLDDGASVAGWSARWRYVWPRDAAFVAAALATTGHTEEALDVLGFLRRVQHRDGSFEARYLPDGSGPPDDRGIQTDGTGWVLWATDNVVRQLDPGDQADAVRRLRPLVDRSTARALELTDRRGTLPPPSSDYWEVGESRVTLGTAAPLLSGLEAAGRLYGVLAAGGTPTAAADAARAAEATAERAAQLRAAIEREFAPRFARYTDGRERDAASAFLLPPFQPTPLTGALDAWRASAAEMARPAGGLAPGAGWKDDGISWTPQTSLYALTAATVGDTDAARGWLTWIDSHRTPSGAIPEKVLADGSPAAVAPLSWSAASVVLAVAELERHGV
ncbi:glycoside hydrolase family 15 [Cellulomonas fimi]|uniref:Glycoside hydrolase family 15 n=1 Tax=Cellulomonas fimi TaxID=1708 RepID=A0A7Y0LYJ7_CELFI|nr:glycoside hydrolase family 15 [Cellulomonas fimi]NMR20304.1 glycoside hydrolase family 15 [Cellulomonas fimi]